ncbi:MAG: acyl-CoA dehydrogenase [Proteobacteria bacterium]|nr:acyl-CoA dehydrogenase [Pseudomonadota bacterium]MCP4921383.1 acyl-CoA dehydrogenase [Pseudomonadota bacterium]
MLSLFHDETHTALYEVTERWARQEIAPHAHAWEEAGHFPDELFAKAGEVGLLGACYPEELGGGGGDILHLLAVCEAMIRGGTSVGTAIGLGSHAIAVPPIIELGSDALKSRIVPAVCSGEKVAALAITEPGVGSDVAGLTTRAVRDGDDYIINGSKTFITSGARADYVTTAVRTGGEGFGGISVLVVDADSPGFSVGGKLQKMGWWASDTAELHYENVRVPAANLLGGENQGFMAITSNFVGERLMLAAICVAMSRLALDETTRYVQERRAFGRSLDGFQTVRHTLAEMATQEESARAFVSTVAERYRRGDNVMVEVAMAKNMACDAVQFVCDKAVQLHGGYGYMREYVVERLYRDARLFPIGGGTTEIMREIISKGRGYGSRR